MPKVELKLHEAMVLAMANRRQFRMLAEDLAEAVRKDGTFLRPIDRKPPPRSQILARAQNKTYRDLFSVTGPKGRRVVALRCSAGRNV